MDDSAELVPVWNRARTHFDDPSIRPQQKAWLQLTRPLGLIENTAVLAAPNTFAKQYLEQQLGGLIAEALSYELGRQVRVAVTVATSGAGEPGERADESTQSPSANPAAPALRLLPADPGSGDVGRVESDDGSGYAPGNAFGNGNDSDSGGNRGHRSDTGFGGDPGDGSFSGDTFTGTFADADDPDDADPFDDPLGDPADGPESAPGSRGTRQRLFVTDLAADRDARLNPKYTFDTFVIGSSNRFTHAAAVAVAEAPARAYNPLFIYGDSGLGKTHLLHAIGHYARRLQPGLRTRYVSSEEFTNDFINSVRDDKMRAFQDRYRSVDLLLIDDIQFIERAERTQEEFFHTFNTLHNDNKQIVISSDKSPRQLSSLEDRLRTRFEWGLISDVQAPDLETRIAILRKKAAQEGMSPPPEVLQFIASRIQSNIRELEGALIRVTAFASLNHQTVELGLAEMVLKDLVGENDAPIITAANIMAVTAEFFGITIDDLTGSSRSRTLAGPRQIAMYLCRELTDLSLPKIGEVFKRDHTTVMHAERKVRGQMTEQRTVYNQIAELTSRIKLRARA